MARVLFVHLLCSLLLVSSVLWVDYPPNVRAENFGQNVMVVGMDSIDEGMPSITVDSEGRVFVVWEQFNRSNQSKGIYIARSDNGGISFDYIRKVNDNISWGEQPSIAIGNDNKIHIVWKDWRNDADLKWVSGGGIDGINNADIYYANSTDGGRSFSANVRVDDDVGTSTVATSTSRRILALDSVRGVHVAWTDVREGFPTIYYANSTDGGISFSKNIKVPHVDADAMNPSLAIGPNDEIFVVWYDYRNASTNADIYLATSSDGGVSFDGDTKVNDDSIDCAQMFPVVATHRDFVSVVWQDMRGGGSAAYFSKSLDKGITFSPNIQVDDGSAAALTPAITTNQTGYIVVAWEDTRETNTSIYFSNSTSQGSTFSPNQRVNDDTAGNRGTPSIAMDKNGYVYLAWSDTRNSGDIDVYFSRAPAEIADLQPLSIAFNPLSPVEEFTMVNLNATIANNGDRDATNVKVQFFHGDPSLGEQIGSNLTVPMVKAGGNGYADTSWLATPLGLHQIFVVVDPENNVTESNESNNVVSAVIEVVLPPPEALPPKDLRTSVVGSDILLDWKPPSDILNVSHYLIYRSEDQREFDFSNPIYNTSNDPVPLRTNWTDPGAATGSPPEYYYVLRTVSTEGRKSTTSNTAGKWTKSFNRGMNTFSLPLQPFDARNISWYADMIPNVDFMEWMESTGHWVIHYPSMGAGINDVPATMGEGYEMSLSSQTDFTFCGYPASMIRFHEGLGDSVTFRKSLSARLEGNDVNLSWEVVTGSSKYLIFRSGERNGLHNLSLSPIVNTTDTYWRDLGIIGNDNGTYYYMVVPIDLGGQVGSSTYSVGVFTRTYPTGFSTFALPLKPEEVRSVDWYCDNIPNVVGIVLMMQGVWEFHAKEMPEGAYDAPVQQSIGYQISVSESELGKFTFIGW